MKLRNVLAAAVCIIMAPAAWILISDLYTGLIAPGSDPMAKQEARLVLWRDVLRGRSRMREMAVLGPAPPARWERMPVIMPRMPAPASLSEALPTCSGYVIPAEKPDNSRLFLAGKIPTLFPMRGELEGDRTYLAHANNLSVPQLAVLDACFRGTPFGKPCSEWLDRTPPTRDEVLAALVEDGWVARRAGSYCWQLPEIRFVD